MSELRLAQLFYDTEGDVLYISLGEPRRAISEELGEDVLLRLDPETGEIVGLTVLNLSVRFASLHDPQNLPLEMILRTVA